ncbi:MAG: sigma-70 family RNA polymerase sigma factor [Bacillota bacterium]
MQQDEMRWVLEAIGGSADAYGRLAERYGRVILGLAYSYVGDLPTAQDIAQETFLKGWLSLGSLHRPERFGSWLRQIAANLARDHLRRRQALVPLAEWDGQGGEEPVERGLLRAEILRCLERLPEGPRTALVLHYLMGLTPAEAAQRLEISRSAFDARLSRGREGLRRELSHLMDEMMTAKQSEAERYLKGLTQRVQAALAEGQRERVTAARELALLAARSNQARLALDLQSHSEATRQRAAQLMAETGDRRAIPALLRALEAEEEPAVQAEYCRALARLGANQALPLLKHLARQTAEMAVHKAASEAARQLEEPVAGDGETADIPVGVDELLAAGIDELLLAMLGDESPQVRAHAADGLGRVESVRALGPLTHLLAKDPQGFVRLAAAEALGAIAGRRRQTPARLAPKQRAQAVEALLRALTDPDQAVVAEAFRSLSLIDLGESTALRARAVDGAFAALPQLLERRPGPWWASLPMLFANLAGEAEMLRLAEVRLRNPAPVHNAPLNRALEEMAAPGRTSANPLILEALRTEPRCPDSLLRALARSRDEAILPVLQEYLGPGGPADPRLWEAAAQGLTQYPQGAGLLRQAMEGWLATGRPEEGALLSIIRALERVGGAEAAGWLEAVAERLPPRARIGARAAARRLKLAT